MIPATVPALPLQTPTSNCFSRDSSRNNRIGLDGNVLPQSTSSASVGITPPHAVDTTAVDVDADVGTVAKAGVENHVGAGVSEGADRSSSVQGLDTGIELPCANGGTDRNTEASTNLPLSITSSSHRNHHPSHHPHNNSNHTNVAIHTDFASSLHPVTFHIPGANVQYGEATGLPMSDPSARRKALAIFHRLEELEVRLNCCPNTHPIVAPFVHTLINPLKSHWFLFLNTGGACRSIGQHTLALFATTSRQQWQL